MVNFYIIVATWILIQTDNSLPEDKQTPHIILFVWIFLQFLSTSSIVTFPAGRTIELSGLHGRHFSRGVSSQYM